MDTQFLLLVLVGVLAGVLGGLLGLGGGILIMPFLRFVLGFPPSLAAGTCVIGVCCTTLAGGLRHYKLKHIHLPSLAPVIVAGVAASAVFSLVFAAAAHKGGWIDAGIGLVFLFVALRMVYAGVRKRHGRDAFSPSHNEIAGPAWKKVLIGLSSGALPGLLGIGSGAILVPAFTMVLDAQIKVAIGSSLACFAANSLVSGVFKVSQGFVDLAVAVPLGLGAVVGANMGATINKQAPAAWLKVLFGLVFLYVAGRFFVSAWKA